MQPKSFNHLYTASLVLGLALGSTQVTPLLLGQTRGQDPSAQQDQQKGQTFLGKIVKAPNGQYALLMDDQSGKGVYLDNQDKAKEFEGKNVKVTGVLDAATGIVHVTAIELA